MTRRRATSTAVTAAAPGRTALLAVLGSSPAVLTETVWALAQATPPVIPDVIVVVTTKMGRDILHRQLLTPHASWRGRTVWQALRCSLLGKNASKDRRLQLEPAVVIGRADTTAGTLIELDDIRTGGDNDAAAEVILTTVRRFTTDSDTRLIGLLAGGRKTMGALLHAALSLAGRTGDRLLHVLVNEPFDHPRLSPLFYFCGQPGPALHALPDGTSVSHESARIEIADVPLVALGELIASQVGHLPATFASLARTADSALRNAQAIQAPIKISFDERSHMLKVNQYACAIPAGRATTLCTALISDAREELEPADRKTLETRWGRKDPVTGQPRFNYLDPNGRPSALNDGDISNALNVVRMALKDAAKAPDVIIDRLFPRRQFIGLNREGITVVP